MSEEHEQKIPEKVRKIGKRVLQGKTESGVDQTKLKRIVTQSSQRVQNQQKKSWKCPAAGLP
jgi:hypothetical protein